MAANMTLCTFCTNVPVSCGFRNLIVHEYEKIELGQVFEIALKDIKDLNDYLKSIFRKLGLAK